MDLSTHVHAPNVLSWRVKVGDHSLVLQIAFIQRRQVPAMRNSIAAEPPVCKSSRPCLLCVFVTITPEPPVLATEG